MSDRSDMIDQNRYKFKIKKTAGKHIGGNEPQPLHLVIGDFCPKESEERQIGRDFILRKRSDINDEILSITKPEMKVVVDQSALRGVTHRVKRNASDTKEEQTDETSDELSMTLVFENMESFSREQIKQQIAKESKSLRGILSQIERLKLLKDLIENRRNIKRSFDELIQKLGEFENLEELLEIFDEKAQEGDDAVIQLWSELEKRLLSH